MPPAASSEKPPTWHILQYSDALDVEFAAALNELVPVILWKPVRSFLPRTASFQESSEALPGSELHIRTFPLMRGFARFPVSSLARTGATLRPRLLRHSSNLADAVLVCTTPFFAPVAERWPGPVVYWLSDLIAQYSGAGYARVRRLDRRMCRSAALVCPNSERIAAYLQHEAACLPERLHVLPNATGVRSLLPAPLTAAMALPRPYADLPRPTAGVIGNLAGNTNWLFLEKLLELVPWLHWLFVGPFSMPIRDPGQRQARLRVMRHERTCFAGAQPYTELYRFARGIDVAILPYLRREPTFSGSSTRFYDHLAAGHPILATTGVAELKDRQPLLRLVHSPEEAADALERLHATGFQDGLREARWRASQSNTWIERAETMRAELERRLRSQL